MNAEGVLKKAEAWRLSSRLVMQVKEKAIESLLLFAALTSVAVTVGIVGILVYESTGFFQQVSLWDFLTDRQWTPLFSEPHYGILPLVSGTLVTTVVALAVAVPVGSLIAIYLSEYASPGSREVVKPGLELLSAVPTVVYGYFALLFVTPALQRLWPSLPGFNMLSAGLVIGIMIVPYVSSVSEDAMRAVPVHLREGAFALGGNTHADSTSGCLSVCIVRYYGGLHPRHLQSHWRNNGRRNRSRDASDTDVEPTGAGRHDDHLYCASHSWRFASWERGISNHFCNRIHAVADDAHFQYRRPCA